MGIEIESKIRVEGHEPIRRALGRIGAEYISRVLETNHIFDRADGSLRRAGSALRIRDIAMIDGRDQKATITYKGPRQKSGLKRREEIETAIDDPDAAKSILIALGYRERLVFEKRRESWRLDACRVELDVVPLLGTFVEVEGPTEEAVNEALVRLGLSELPFVAKGYVALLAERMKTSEERPMEFRFDSAAAE